VRVVLRVQHAFCGYAIPNGRLKRALAYVSAFMQVGSETGVLRLLAVPSALKSLAAACSDGTDASCRTPPTRPIQVCVRVCACMG